MKTIAEKRIEEAKKLAALNPALPEEHAFTVMNSLYRYIALRERNVYEDNCESTCNTRRHHQEEARENRWLKRLERWFNEYGLMIVFYGIYPTITDRRGGDEKIYLYFYED